MKTEEDEAFDEIARKQGGGFTAKRRMAADKLQDGKCKLCVDGCIACDARLQPAQKIPYPVTGWKVEVRGSNQRLFITGVYGDTIFVDLPEAQPAQEPDMLTIAYQSGYYDGKKAALAGREWVGLKK